MYEWSDEHKMIRDAVRDFVEKEVRPRREELEFGDTPPYDVIRKLYATFGMGEMAKASFARRIAREKGEAEPAKSDDDGGGPGAGFMLLPIIELCRCSPGLVTLVGVSTGLAAFTIISWGTIEQMERVALVLLKVDRVSAWAIT